MSDQWSSDPGAYPPAPTAVPTGFQTRPGQLAPDGPPPFGSGPAVPPLPPARGPKPGSTTRTLLIAVGVLAVLLLLVTAGLVVSVRSDDGEVAAPAPTTAPTTSSPRGPSSSTTAPSGSAPPSTTAPLSTGPPPTPEELDAEIAELSEFVEEERGLTFTTPVEAVMADGEEFEELLFADFDEDAELRAESARVLQALGLLDADLDVDEAIRQLLAASVLGFYDPATGQLVIRGGAITPYIRQTIVHELTHALEDQEFELDRPEYDELDDETGFGFDAVVEGSARTIESAYVASLSAADKARRDEEEAQFGASTQPLVATTPLILLKSLQAPYEYGPTFVEGLLQFGGQPMLDDTIDLPPTTSAEVLHLERYLSGVGGLDVAAPQADGPVVDEGVFGELMTQFTLEDSEDPNVATNAASGWAGDRYVTWEDDEGSSCIRIAYEMETSLDLDELEDAYTSWAEPRGATVERVGNDTLEVTSCAAMAGGASPL